MDIGKSYKKYWYMTGQIFTSKNIVALFQKGLKKYLSSNGMVRYQKDMIIIIIIIIVSSSSNSRMAIVSRQYISFIHLLFSSIELQKKINSLKQRFCDQFWLMFDFSRQVKFDLFSSKKQSIRSSSLLP